MPAVYQTAYPRLKTKLSPEALEDSFQIKPSEKRFVLRHCRAKSAAQLGMMLQLKMVQRLGRFTSYSSMPSEVIKYIRDQIKSPVKLDQLKNYFSLATRHRHVKLIRQHLKLVPYSKGITDQVHQWAIDAAKTKSSVADIINVVIERLVQARIELPGFRELERKCESARHAVNQAYYQQIAQHLDPEGLQIVHRLFEKPTSKKNAWIALKIEAKKPTPRNIKHYLVHLEWLKSLQFLVPEQLNLPPAKYDQFIDEAMALNHSEMMALKYEKRIALAIVLIRHQYAKTLDDAAYIIIKSVRKIDNVARQRLEKHLLAYRNQTDTLIEVLKDIIESYSDNNTHLLDQIISVNKDELLSMCHAHLAFAHKNYLPFMLPLYRNHRNTLFRAMSILSFETTTKDKDTLKALAFICNNKNSKGDWHTIVDASGRLLVSTKWIREKWWQVITGKKSRTNKIKQVHKFYFEMSVFERIAEELTNGDVFIPQANDFNDYRRNFITQEEYDGGLTQYCTEVGIKSSAKAFIQTLKQELETRCRTSDDNMENNLSTRLVEGKLVITPGKAKERSRQSLKLIKEIQKRLEKSSLLDIIIDAEKWLNLSKHFGPLSGNEGKLDDPMMRFVLTVFCYGTNIGPTETARSVRGITRKQAAWLNLKRVNEKRLDKAIATVANAYKNFGIIKHWGSGKSASADGKLWNAYEDNLLSEYHIRYGSYGGIAYYHVSDTYIALFSHFIPCGVYEAIYILDGLLNDESDFNPDTLHGDTQAQSTPVFGLAYLLGIKLMPRIRNIKELQFYKPNKHFKFRHLAPLFRESINWHTIEKHYDDMMQIAMSVKAGKMTASTILRRFGTKNRKNKVYFAFRELGRVVRTLFLLEYISDQDMRKMVHAATCKSEEFNEFARWLFFANNSKIAANDRAQQTKIVKYNHLLANIAALHNVNSMTKIFNELKQEGYPLTDELIAGCSPYHTEHFSRFGSFDPDLNRQVRPLDFNLLA